MNPVVDNQVSHSDDDTRAKDLYKAGQLSVRPELGEQTFDRLSSRRWWRPSGNSPRFWARLGQSDPFQQPQGSRALQQHRIYAAGRLVRLEIPQAEQRKHKGFSSWEDPFTEISGGVDDLKERLQLWESTIPMAKTRPTRSAPRPPDATPEEERHVPRPTSTKKTTAQTKGGRMRMSRPSSGSQKPTIVQEHPPVVKP